MDYWTRTGNWVDIASFLLLCALWALGGLLIVSSRLPPQGEREADHRTGSRFSPIHRIEQPARPNSSYDGRLLVEFWDFVPFRTGSGTVIEK